MRWEIRMPLCVWPRLMQLARPINLPKRQLPIDSGRIGTSMGLHSEVGLPPGTQDLLRSLIHERTGVFFDNGRSDLLTDKLAPLVIDRGFTSFLDYYYLLKYDDTAADEWHKVMNALCVPETYFWREIDQLRALVDVVMPEWFSSPRVEPFRIWSAACATGEEPLTIAMLLNEGGWFERGAIEILASDASPSVVAKAQGGIYRERSFRNLAPELRSKYFTPGPGVSTWQVKEDLHRRIRWGVANLVSDAQIAAFATSHTIFCRNVFIYFSDSAISKAVSSFAKYIRPPGYLFIGVSESILRLTTKFTLEEIGNAFVYVKESDRKPAIASVQAH
jgi:chemotaxis protein methyltransferase CheR